MNLKLIRPISIFLLLSVGVHLFLRVNGWPGSIAFLVFVPAIYAIFYLLKGIVLLIKREQCSALNSLTIAVLFALIFDKFYYEYYNILLSTLLLVFSVWITRLAWKKEIDENSKKNKVTLLSLLAMNLFIVFISDKSLCQYILAPKDLSWRQLTWDDFKGTPDNSNAAAKTGSGIGYKINKVFNYPPAVLFAYMTPESSWVKQLDSISERARVILLEHEQGHFNLAELYTRKAHDSVLGTWGKSEKYVETIILYWEDKLNEMNDIYDSSTIHGSDTINQHIWTKEIQEMLQSTTAQNPIELIHFAKIAQVIRQQDIDYIGMIFKNMYRANGKMGILLNQLMNQGEMSKQDKNRKLPDSLINIYTNSYNEALLAIDSSLEAYSNLVDRDTTIKLRQSILHYWEKEKKIDQEAIPLLISVLKYSYGNMTSEQSEAFVWFRLQASTMKSESNEINKQIGGFLSHHNISYEELKKAGVIKGDD